MRYLFTLFALLISSVAFGQQTFSRQDSLRGTLSPLRSCYDVHFYDLNLNVDMDEKTIAGYNVFHTTATEDFSKIQIDLFEEMSLDSILDANGAKLNFEREGNATFVIFKEKQTKGSSQKFTVFYHGKPRIAPNAPWDGGFSWKKDKYDRPWVGVSCEGLGASVWWPNKDHLSEEPDSMRIYVEVPEDLYAVANGNLRSLTKLADDKKGYEWFVSYPINNYNVTLNIAHYRHFTDYFESANGEKMNLDYYVLDYNIDKARAHFKQVAPMLDCFEKLFGPYPFTKDGYALVETPYWGMEHQSAIAYGNNYVNLKPWGFDFIIIHESGHEYFGNSISVRDHAEMWIHESFTTYAEALYLECTQDLKTANDYLMMQRGRIGNKQAILAPLGVNFNDWPDADMYYKGSWMLHTLRNVVNDDELWLKTIYDFHQDNRLSHMNTEEVITFFEQKTGKTLAPIFYEYLNYTEIPTLKYEAEQKGSGVKLSFEWEVSQADFEMPVQVRFRPDGAWHWITPKVGKTQSLKFRSEKLKKVEIRRRHFYVEVEERG